VLLVKRTDGWRSPARFVVLDPAEEAVQFVGSAVIRGDPPQVAAEHLVRVHEVGV
jgi:hypothetical protein